MLNSIRSAEIRLSALRKDDVALRDELAAILVKYSRVVRVDLGVFVFKLDVADEVPVFLLIGPFAARRSSCCRRPAFVPAAERCTDDASKQHGAGVHDSRSKRICI